MANSASQFIGSRISLVSKAEIRYEGVLYALDAREATISLAKVKSYGTEDRPTERPIPIKDETYEFIIFRGQDIKSIDVTEPPKSFSTMSCGLHQDPAILEVSHYQRSSGHNNYGGESMRFTSNRGGEGVFDGILRGGRGHQGRRSSQEAGNQTDRRRNNSGRNNYRGGGDGRRSRQDNFRGGSGSRGGRGNTPNRGRGGGSESDRDRTRATSGNREKRQKGIIQAQMPPKVTFDEAFDFEKSHEEMKTAMEKLKIGDDDSKKESETTVLDEKKEELIYYDKDKFFDNISCEALEGTQMGRQPRSDWRAERKMNAETFGLTWNPNQNQNQRNNGQRNYNNRMRNNRYRGNSQGRSYNNGGFSNGNGGRYRTERNDRNERSGYGNRGQQQRT